MTTPAFKLLRPEPLESAWPTSSSHIPHSIWSANSIRIWPLLTPPLLSSLTWMFAVTSFGPLPLQVYSHHGSQKAPVKMQVQNLLWLPIWLRMKIKALTVAPKPHQGPVSFLISTSSPRTLNLFNLCAYVNLSPLLGKAHVAVTRFPKDSQSPQSLILTNPVLRRGLFKW